MKNRWGIALSAVGIHASLGIIYAWSVFKAPFMDEFGWNEFQAGIPFGLSIFCLGISAAMMGHIVEKRGPRFSGLVACVLWAIGQGGIGLVTSDFIADNTLRMWLVYLFCIIGGIGLGTGYVTPVATLMKWFPDRRGLATGIAIMGFGFGAFLGAPIMAIMISGGQIISILNFDLILPFTIPTLGVSATFAVLAIICAVVMLFSALYLEVPANDGKFLQTELKIGQQPKNKLRNGLFPMMANEAVKTWPFYGLWLMMFINILCGIALISVISPMTQEITGVSAVVAGGIVGIFGLFNGLGRIGWAYFSDLIGRPSTYILFFIGQIIAFYFLPSLNNIIIFQCILYFIASCYGGGYATLPAYIGDVFGTRQVSAIHGYILTSWAIAGITGSSLASLLHSKTGSYVTMMMIFAVIMILGLLVSCCLKIFIVKELANKKSSKRVSQNSC